MSVYSLAATGLIGCGVIFLSRAVFAKELSNLRVAPRPERVTELYFTNYHKPPASLRPGSAQKVAFTVHNLEHRTTKYHYRLVAKLPNGSLHLWNEGAFTLASNDSRVTSQMIVIPSLAGRTAVEVELDYMSQIFGSNAYGTQKQSIHYWIEIADTRTRL